MSLPTLELKPGHVRPIWAGHPWVFAQAVAKTVGNPEPGAEVLVLDAKRQPLGRALYSPRSALVARMYTRDEHTPIDAELFAERLRRAQARRDRLGLPAAATTGYRVAHAEADDLPGLVVDRLGDALAVQFGTLGLMRHRDAILDALQAQFSPSVIVDRSSASAAQREGFTAERGVARGDDGQELFTFLERGQRFEVPLALGQKTGFYFDQRPLRSRITELAAGRRVLDTYCFVGAISLAAAAGGAKSVRGVDTSGDAIETARTLAALNGVESSLQFVQADAQEELSRDQAAYDLVVCDPPKLAPSRGAAKRAQSIMRRLAAASCNAVGRDGLVVLCSCSAAITADDLARALALGAADAKRRACILERVYQGPDHPVPAAFPEGLYLSNVIAEIS